ncbi:hypothetical protein ACWGJV_10810 [Streptomyces tendae]
MNFPSFDPATDQRVVTVVMTTSTAFVVGPRLTRPAARRAPHATLRLRMGDQHFVERLRALLFEAAAPD